MERLIIESHLAGKTQDQIAAQCHCGKTRVNTTIRLYKQTGNIPKAQNIGRPTKITPQIIEFVRIRTIQDCETTNLQIANEILRNYNIKISEMSIATLRRELKFNFSPPRHEQKLTPEHIRRRMDFCQKMLGQINVLSKIAFSDESRFVLGSDKKWRWLRRGEEQDGSTVANVKFPQAIMVFGVIGVGYKSKLLIVDSTINTERYIQNCEDVNFISELNALHGTMGWIFMQDGATCHTAEASMDYLEGSCDVIADWPANSPDLNPIEMLWSIMKKRVENRTALTKDELKAIVTEVWEEISQDLIDRLCLSFEYRLRLTIGMNGESISRDLNLTDDYKNYISTVNIEPWTPMEDQILLHQYHSHGHCWKLISRFLPDRTPSACKNRWMTVGRKKYKHFLNLKLGQIAPQFNA